MPATVGMSSIMGQSEPEKNSFLDIFILMSIKKFMLTELSIKFLMFISIKNITEFNLFLICNAFFQVYGHIFFIRLMQYSETYIRFIDTSYSKSIYHQPAI